MKTLGVIGGLGPMATARLLTRVIEMTDAETDQEHLDVIVFNRPQVPDRTAYLLDPANHPSPLPSMQATAKTLESVGAQVLCAPCVTAHCYFSDLAGAVSVPFINMAEETAEALAAAGKKKIGILATSGTVKTGLFQQVFSRHGLDFAIPGDEGQKQVMEIIYDEVKAGLPVDAKKVEAVCAEMFALGCDCLVLGCTELSLIPKELLPEQRTLDALDVLAQRCVSVCGGALRKEFVNLL